MRRRSFGPMTQVFVNEKSKNNLPTDIDREKQVVLPPGSATPGGGGRDIGKFEYNTPDADSDIKPRTLSVPGEQYGNPSNDTYNTVTRRTMTGFLTIAQYIKELELEEPCEEEEMEESLKKRQKKQKGRARHDSKMYYKKNKQKIKKQQKQYRKKNKQKIKRYKHKTKGKDRTRRNASAINVVSMYLGVY